MDFLQHIKKSRGYKVHATNKEFDRLIFTIVLVISLHINTCSMLSQSVLKCIFGKTYICSRCSIINLLDFTLIYDTLFLTFSIQNTFIQGAITRGVTSYSLLIFIFRPNTIFTMLGMQL